MMLGEGGEGGRAPLDLPQGWLVSKNDFAFLGLTRDIKKF